jgi:hypothetical protein
MVSAAPITTEAVANFLIRARLARIADETLVALANVLNQIRTAAEVRMASPSTARIRRHQLASRRLARAEKQALVVGARRWRASGRGRERRPVPAPWLVYLSQPDRTTRGIAMPDKLTWDEIKRRYPDEWVAVVDYHVEGCDLTDGVVVAHDKDREQVYQYLARERPKDCATWFTGRVRGAMFGFQEDDEPDVERPGRA